MIKEGMVPLIAGTVVMSTGALLKAMEMKDGKSRRGSMFPMAAAGIIGFGLAHIVLGSIDMAQNRHHKHQIFNQ